MSSRPLGLFAKQEHLGRGRVSSSLTPIAVLSRYGRATIAHACRAYAPCGLLWFESRYLHHFRIARLAELADALASNTSVEKRECSSHSSGTKAYATSIQR